MFTGFSPADFAAYEERKWASNAFTLERMKVKEKVQALLTEVLALFSGSALTAHLSEEHPSIMNNKRVDSQLLFFCRSSEQAQDLTRFLEKTELKPDKIFNLAPQDKHASLALVVDNKGVHFGLIAHAGAWVDRKNFAAKLENSWDREMLRRLLGELPAEVGIGFGDETIPAREMEQAAFESLADMLRQDERGFAVWRSMTADDAQSMGGEFAQTLRATFQSLLALYTFFAWSRTNDHIQVHTQLQTVKAEKRKNATEFKIGDKVRVLSGLFSGKTGNVQAIDTKAHVKVQIGAMAVNVPAQDLARN